MELLIELIKYCFPALIVFLTTYVLIDNFFKKQIRQKELELQLKSQQQILPLRLQAYERLILYLERISPADLIKRLREEALSAPELQFAMINTIRAELQHNITQQIYVSPEAWESIKLATEEMIGSINAAATELPKDAQTNDLIGALLKYFGSLSTGLPTERAIHILKKEAYTFFS